MNSNTIDERIVSMEFDNERFEKNINQSMRSLEALDETIDDSARGITGSFLDIDNGLSRLDLVFAGFYTKIGGYLADLSMKAVKFAKSLSFDQVNAGFAKYTAETLAVQTITSNTNNTLEETYKVLGDILDYTDKTSYHYDSMSNTLSKFANQGVDLREAAVAVKGIANWAAISGAGIDKADIAMNALIKSMASGSMQMREWRTISQVANMGTTQFKETLLETAQAMAREGKASKDWLKLGLSDIESDSVFGNNKLITSGVMLEVLKKYGDETGELGQKALAAASEAKTFAEALGAVKDAVSTGYGLSFRYIFGDYVEGKTFWTGVQDAMLEVFTLGQEFRNNMLKTWHGLKNGGYLDFVHSLADAWEHVKQLAAPIGEAFRRATEFTPLKSYVDAANALAGLVNKFQRFTTFEFNFSTNVDELIESYKTFYGITRKGFDEKIFDEATKKAERNAKIIGTIRELFYNIFETINYARLNIKDFISGFNGIFSGIGSAAKSIIGFATTVSDFILKVHMAALEVDLFSRIAKSITKVVNSILKPAFSFISKLFGGISSKIQEAFPTWDGIAGVLDKIAGAFEWLADVLVNKAITPAINGISKALGYLKERCAPLIGLFKDTAGAVTSFLAGFNKGDTTGVEKVNSVLEKLGDTMGKVFGFIGDLINKIIDRVKEFFKGKSIKDVFDAINGVLASMTLVKLFTFVKNLNWISEQFESFADKLGGTHYISTFRNVSIALLIFAAAMAVIASIDNDKLGKTFGVITGLLAEIVAATYALSALTKGNKGIFNLKAIMEGMQLNTIAKSMTKVATAVVILAVALKIISTIDSDGLVKGLIGVGALLEMIVIFEKQISKTGLSEGADSLILIGIAINVLSIAVKSLGKLDLATLAKGLGAVGAALLEFVVFAKLLKAAKVDAGTGFAIIEIAIGIAILSKSIKTLGDMNPDILSQGLGAIGIALAGIGAILNIFPKNTPAIGAGLILVAAGLAIVSGVMKIFSTMSIEELQNSIGALAASLIILGAALQLMKGTISGAAAMLIISAALIPFSIAMKMLASIPLKGIGKGLLSILVVFGAFALLATILSPVIVVLLSFSAVVLAIGTGLLMLSTALLTINSLGSVTVTLLAQLMASMMKKLPELFATIAEGILSFAQVLTAGIDVIRQLIEAIVLAVLDVLIAAVPKVVELGVTLLTALIEGIGTVIPLLIDTILEIVLQLLKSIEDKLPDFIESGTNIVVAFIDGMANMAVEIVNAAFRMVITIINGIADAIRTHNPELLKAGWNLLTAIWDGFWDAVLGLAEKLWNAGAEIVKGIKEGLDEKITIIKDWVLDIPNKIKKWIAEKWQDAKDAGLNIINGIKDGLAGGEGGLFTKIGGIASGLLNKFKNTLGIKSPSRVFAQMGGYIDQGLANGISQYANLVNDPARQLAENAVGPVEEAVNTLNDLNLGEFSDPVVRPVLDLSEIQNGARNIGGMFGNGYSVGLGLGNVTGALSGSFAGGGNAPIINMTVNGADGQNVEELAAAVSRRLNSELRSRNSIWK